MKSNRVTRLQACRLTAIAVMMQSGVSIAFVCKDDEHRKMINEYLGMVWAEIPEWMKPELMVRNTRQFKFANHSAVRLVLRPDYLRGGTYNAVYTYGPASDVEVWCLRDNTGIIELLD